jgi:hypothetical protein
VIADGPEYIFQVEDRDFGASSFNATQAIPVMMPTTPSLSVSSIVPLTIAASSSQSAVVPIMDKHTATPDASSPLPFTASQSRRLGDTPLLIWSRSIGWYPALRSPMWLWSSATLRLEPQGSGKETMLRWWSQFMTTVAQSGRVCLRHWMPPSSSNARGWGLGRI